MAPGMEKRYRECEEGAVPLQLHAIQNRRQRFLLPDLETETQDETEKEAPEPVALDELKEYMPSTAVMVDADEHTSRGSTSDDSDSDINDFKPEGKDDQVEPDAAPALNADETDVPAPSFYDGNIDAMSLTQSESESSCARRFNRKFGNLKKTFTRADLSKVENTFSITRTVMLAPPQ